MTDITDIRRRIKLAVERLADLEEELAHCRHHAIAGDAEASAACAGLMDEIETAKMAILDLQAVPERLSRPHTATRTALSRL